jgi:hypothetical protein
MSLALKLHIAHKGRQARFEEAARRLREKQRAREQTPLLLPPPEPEAAPAEMVEAGEAVERIEAKRLEATEESVKLVLRAVAAVTGMTVKEIMGRSRLKECVVARHLTRWVLLVALDNAKITWLAAVLKVDHSTIIHSWWVIQSRRSHHAQAITLVGQQLDLRLNELERQRTREIMWPKSYGKAAATGAPDDR